MQKAARHLNERPDNGEEARGPGESAANDASQASAGEPVETQRAEPDAMSEEESATSQEAHQHAPVSANPLEREGAAKTASSARERGVGALLRRFFLMGDALREAEQRAFRPGDSGWHAFELARQAFESAEALRDFPERKGAQLVMMRDAATLAVRARVERASGSPVGPDGDLWAGLSALPGSEELMAGLSAECRERARELVADHRHQRIAELGHAERMAWDKDLSDFATVVLDGLVRDAEATARVRTSSAARISAAIVGVLVVVGVVVALAWPTHELPNLALGRPVALSSNYDVKRFPPASVVDGKTDDLGCHSKVENRPWLRIDLGAIMEIEEVVVFNRNELRERAVPLVVEVSEDGKKYQKYAERKDPFDKWRANEGEVTARYVRLRVQKNRTALHLNEVEVF